MTVKWRQAMCALAITAGLGTAACASDASAEVFTGKDLQCDQDPSSDDAKSIVEEVGGLVTDEYTVKFAKATKVGVVALVEGNIARAFQELRDDYGVVAVTRLDGSRDPGSVSGFAQVDEVVAGICGG